MNYYLEFKKDGSSKFWKLDLEGNSFTVTYGKIGTDGVTNTKTFENEETAQKEAQKLVAAKRKKGYKDAEDLKAAAKSEVGSPADSVTMEDFFAELFPALEKMEKELQDNFWNFYEKEGISDYHLEYHDTTWTGFIDRVEIKICSIKVKEGIYSDVQFEVSGKWSSPFTKVEFSKIYAELLTEENLNIIIAPKIISWLQERIDKEKHGGFYSAYLDVFISIDSKERKFYQTKKPLVSEARRKQVREYVKKCIETKDYSEWKTMKDNPAHLEVFWLYKELDLKDIKVYFKRIQNLNRSGTSLYYLYPSHRWQLEEFYNALLEDTTITLNDCKQINSFNEVIKEFIHIRAIWDFPLVEKDEFVPITKLYEKLGFQPEEYLAEETLSQDISFIEDVCSAIDESYDMYANAFGKEREDVFKGHRRSKDKPLPNWSKEGLAIAFIEVNISSKVVSVWERAYDFTYHVSNKGEDFRFSVDLKKEYNLEAISDQEKQALLNSLEVYFQKVVEENKEDLYLPIVNLSLHIGPKDQTESYWTKAQYTTNISREGSEEWIKKLQKTHDNLVDSEGEKEGIYSNMLEVFESLYVHIFHYDWPSILLFAKKYATIQYGVYFGNSALEKISHHLDGEMRRLLQRKGIQDLRKKITAAFTQDEVDYISFSADMIKTNLTESWEKDSRKLAAMLEKLLGKIEVVEEES